MNAAVPTNKGEESDQLFRMIDKRDEIPDLNELLHEVGKTGGAGWQTGAPLKTRSLPTTKNGKMILFVCLKLNGIHDQGRKCNWIKPHSCPRCGSDSVGDTASLWLILMALPNVCFCVASDAGDCSFKAARLF
jgi:hypothetical protein